MPVVFYWPHRQKELQQCEFSRLLDVLLILSPFRVLVPGAGFPQRACDGPVYMESSTTLHSKREVGWAWLAIGWWALLLPGYPEREKYS